MVWVTLSSNIPALSKVLKDNLGYYGASGSADTRVWGVLHHAVETVEGNSYLIPDKILSIKDSHFIKAGIREGAIGQTKESLSNAIRRYLLDRVNTGIATPGQIERHLMYFGTRPGTPEGEFWRFSSMYGLVVEVKVFFVPQTLQDIPAHLPHEAAQVRDC